MDSRFSRAARDPLVAGAVLLLGVLLLAGLVSGCGDKDGAPGDPEDSGLGGSGAGEAGDGGSGSEGDAGSGDEGGGDDTGEREIDADGDGFPRPEDCDDGDPAVNPGATEDCADGRDNDCDGLADCEDGHCHATGACVETACADEVDDDLDGDVDCRDLDCLGTSECAHVQVLARVTGGRGRLREGAVRVTYSTPSFQTAFARSTWRSLALSSISGTAHVATGSGGFTTCTWTVAQVSGSQGYWSYQRGTSHPRYRAWDLRLRRDGFAMDSACPVQTSGFLPDQGYLAASAVGLTDDFDSASWHDTLVWGFYSPASLVPTTSSSTWTTAFTGYSRQVVTREIPSLLPGQRWAH